MSLIIGSVTLTLVPQQRTNVIGDTTVLQTRQQLPVVSRQIVYVIYISLEVINRLSTPGLIDYSNGYLRVCQQICGKAQPHATNTGKRL